MKLVVTIMTCGICTGALCQKTRYLTGLTDTLTSASPPTSSISISRFKTSTTPTPLPQPLLPTLQNVLVKSTAAAPLPAGAEKMAVKEIKNIPVFLGEPDLMKTIQLLPGVQSAGDGNSGFYVRGGNADQNLVLLDGAPIYNTAHLLGLFSIFNSDAVKDFTLFKGSLPAQYGGRLSSVLDVNMNEGSDGTYKVNGGAGLIATRLSVEGPLQKNKSSFLISGRRTYADLLLKASRDSAIKNNDLHFYDLNLKLHLDAGEQDQLYISAYAGHDLMRIGKLFSLDWGNKAASLQWKHFFADKTQLNTTLYYSHYDYTANVSGNQQTFATVSRITELGYKTEATLVSGTRHDIKLGLQVSGRLLRPGQTTLSLGKTTTAFTQGRGQLSMENALHISDIWKLSDNIRFSYGIRVSAFSLLGGPCIYQVNTAGAIIDTLRYGRGQIVKTYLKAEPRIAVNYTLTKNSSFSLFYTRNVQHMHLVANTTSATPTDKWITSSNNIPPEIADQTGAGYALKSSNNMYQLSIEAYYKALQNQLDYRNGAEVFNNDPIETKLLYGKGRAYGMEWMLKKKKGRLTGWITYTLSRTERKIDGISNNQWYLAKQDRTHEIAIVTSFQLSGRWVLSANWVYNTGNAVTLPAGKYVINNHVAYYYMERNGYRMPAYHRLDIAATVQLTQRQRFSSDLNIGLYNAYGRENAYSISFRSEAGDPAQTEAVQLSLFRFIPSVTYHFNF